MGLNLNLLTLILSVLSILTAVAGLRCYQCYSNSLEACPPEDLRECPRFQFYNRCSVKVRQLLTGEKFVKRECAVGPCHGYDGEYGEQVQLEDHCDTHKNEYECYACCKGDGCNRNGAAGLRGASALLSTGIFFLVLRTWLR